MQWEAWNALAIVSRRFLHVGALLMRVSRTAALVLANIGIAARAAVAQVPPTPQGVPDEAAPRSNDDFDAATATDRRRRSS
jgi:hypothetical protein